MPTFRETLLADVSDVCRQLYEHRLATVREQALVSEKAKQDVTTLINQLHELFILDPFPEAATLDASPIAELKSSLAQADGDRDAVEEKLMSWVRQTTPVPQAPAEGQAEAVTAAIAASTSPINQRMIDGLAAYRSAIDRSRVRLLRDRDRYDRKEYTAARNAFTLARSAYAGRLRLNQVEATNEDCARLEQELIPAVVQSTGATFPAAIQAGADFMSARIFV